jgi:Domain of unknown function (DUF4349)
MNYRTIALLIVCIAVVAAAGCTGISGGGTAKSIAPQEVVSVAHGDMRYASDANTGSAGGPGVPPQTAVPTIGVPGGSGTDTKIIKTAYLTLEVGDVTASVETLKNLAAQRGGYISSTNVQKNYNDQLTGTVIIRVPAAEFDNALTGAKALGTVKSLSTQGEDVTEEYVDVKAQIISYQNQLAQYNEIMKKAVKVQDILDIQQQIDSVQTQLDRLNGRMKYLDNRIDLSTITVSLQEPEPVGGPGGHDFVVAINEGIAGFFGVVDAIIVLVLSVLPLIVLGGAGYGVYRLWKRDRAGKPAPETIEKK